MKKTITILWLMVMIGCGVSNDGSVIRLGSLHALDIQESGGVLTVTCDLLLLEALSRFPEVGGALAPCLDVTVNVQAAEDGGVQVNGADFTPVIRPITILGYDYCFARRDDTAITTFEPQAGDERIMDCNELPATQNRFIIQSALFDPASQDNTVQPPIWTHADLAELELWGDFDTDPDTPDTVNPANSDDLAITENGFSNLAVGQLRMEAQLGSGKIVRSNWQHFRTSINPGSCGSYVCVDEGSGLPTGELIQRQSVQTGGGLFCFPTDDTAAQGLCASLVAPVITGLSPSEISGADGADITIAGTGLGETFSITVGSLVKEGPALTVSSGSVGFQIGANELLPGTYNIVLKFPDGGTLLEIDALTVLAPSITGLSPATIIGAVGAEITIVGIELGQTVSLRVGSELQVLTSVTSSTIVFNIAANVLAVAKYSLVLGFQDGTSLFQADALTVE
jgi:hypothetical protein